MSAINASQKNRVSRNIGNTERLIPSIFGGSQLIRGLTRRSLPGLARVATGAFEIDAHRDALNSNHPSNQSYDGVRLEGSIEKKYPSLTQRRKQTAKAIVRRKAILKAATVSGVPKN